MVRSAEYPCHVIPSNYCGKKNQTNKENDFNVQPIGCWIMPRDIFQVRDMQFIHICYYYFRQPHTVNIELEYFGKIKFVYIINTSITVPLLPMKYSQMIC